MAKKDKIYMVYRDRTETGDEKIEVGEFKNEEELKAKIAEIEMKSGSIEVADEDSIIGIFAGNEIKFQTSVKIEVTLH